MSTSSENSWIFDSTPNYLHISDLLTRLQSEGFAVDVSHYSAIQTILQSSKIAISSEELASLLCPLFAKTAEEQTQFYSIFQECIRLEQLQSLELEKPTNEVISNSLGIEKFRKHKLALVASLLFFLATISMVFWVNRKPLLQEVDFKKIEIQPKEKIEELEELLKTKAQTTPLVTENTTKENKKFKLKNGIELENYNFQTLPLKVEDVSIYEAKELWWYTHKILLNFWL
jgi:hypothetical protein